MNRHTREKADALRAIDPIFDQLAAAFSGDLEALMLALNLVQTIEAAYPGSPESLAAVQRAAALAKPSIVAALDAHRAMLADLQGSPLGAVLSSPPKPPERA